MRRLPIFMIAAALALSGGVAGAHDGASGIVKERMEQMKGFAAATKTIKSELSKGAGYDPAVIQAEAASIQRHAGAALTKFYPSGSMHPPSEASAAIWQNQANFEAAAILLGSRASALQNAPTPDNAKAAFAELLQSCAACHKRFREKRK